jgi:hypothetical protein
MNDSSLLETRPSHDFSKTLGAERRKPSASLGVSPIALPSLPFLPEDGLTPVGKEPEGLRHSAPKLRLNSAVDGIPRENAP